MKTIQRLSLPLFVAGFFIFVIAISTLLLAAAQTEAGETFIDHAGTLLPYDGAATCLECHTFRRK